MTFFRRYRTYILLSIIAHVLLVVAMFMGSWFKIEPEPGKKRMVQAMIIDPDAIERQAESARARRAQAQKTEQETLENEQKKVEQEQARQEKIEQQREQKLEQEKAEKEKRAEIQRKAKEDEIKKQKDLEKKKADEKLAQEKEKQKKLAEEQKKKEDEKLAQEKAEQKKAEEERKKEAEEKKKQEEADKKSSQESAIDDLFAGIDIDETAVVAPIANAPVTGRSDPGSAKEKYDVSEVDKYIEIYRRMVTENLSNAGNFKGKTCEVYFKLTPTGRKGIIRSQKILSGDDKLCRESLNALTRLKELPLPADKAVVRQLSELKLVVKL